MARIRSIHPGFFTDETFVQVSAHARLLLIGLGVEADDKGTFPWKPIMLKMRLFPMDVIDIQGLLRELTDVDIIRRYKVAGKEYGAIRNFRQHQRPKKPNDINPMPDEFGTYVGLTDDSSIPVPNRFGKSPADGGCRMEDVEEDGISKRAANSRGKRLPSNFEPILTPSARSIVDNWPPGMLRTELSKFTDHHTAKGSLMKDWQAAFRTWITKADEWRSKRRENRNGNDNRSGLARAIDQELGVK